MSQPRRILLIEDSRTQAERLRELLSAQGWEVVCEITAEAALEAMNRRRPDLIVVDYYLPGMRGDEFCREIRMNVDTRGIPILMLTVDGTHDAETRGLESGADDYLAKSVDPDILVLRVGALLRKAQGLAAILETGDHFTRARVLAIDDSPTYLEYLAQELGREGYVVAKASGGREGLARLGAEPFDCVLVDLEMPDMDGIEVCRQLAERRRDTGVLVPVLMLTAHEEKEYMTRGLSAGADDFVGKSADMAVLKARIRALLRRQFFAEENRRILEELQQRELETVRARAEKEAAEVRATMADRLARTNGELEEANRKLEEALSLTRAITDNAAEALFMTDTGGQVTFLNPAAERMFGYRREELLGRNLHETIHRCRDGTPYPVSDCPLVRCFQTGATVTGHEDLFFRRDGTPVEVSCSSGPVVQGGRISAAVLVVHDISERKRSEERLRQAQKLESVGLLAGGIAHDFNNILTGIMGTASLIEEELPPETAGGLRAIVQGAEKAANLTRQLLAYAGKGQFVIEQLDLSAVVRDMAGLIRLSVPRHVEVRYELGAGLPLIAADPGQLQQVLMNLVINGGEAIGKGDGGVVVLSTGVEELVRSLHGAAVEAGPGRYVYLQVADNGSGMDAPTQARILDPFFTTKFTGRGLGLAAVSGIVRAQKGAILIDSSPGKGSTFRVLFPAAAVPRSAAPALPDGTRPGILVAEDEAGVREFLRCALERAGYKVLLARNGKEGLSLWHRHRDAISLVLLDLIAPVAGGPSLLAEIRRGVPGARVLVTSGYEEAEAERLCGSPADTLYIQKPYTATALLAKVKAALEKE